MLRVRFCLYYRDLSATCDIAWVWENLLTFCFFALRRRAFDFADSSAVKASLSIRFLATSWS